MINTGLPIYGLMIILSIICNFIIISLIYDKNKFSKSDILIALIYEVIGIFVGAKLLTLIMNLDKDLNDLNFLNAGFSSYGAIIGALINLLVYANIFKKDVKDILMLFIIPIPLMYAIGKIGCFFAGCCYGIEYAGPRKCCV